MSKLQITIENQDNAINYTIQYRTPEEAQWSYVTVNSFPYNLKGLEENTPIILKVKKNCHTKPCSSVGAVGYNWID